MTMGFFRFGLLPPLSADVSAEARAAPGELLDEGDVWAG